MGVGREAYGTDGGFNETDGGIWMGLQGSQQATMKASDS